MLEGAGYRVTASWRPADVLAELGADEQTPDALVTDLVMPDVDGERLAERARSRWPSLPVVVMSGGDPGDGRS